MLMINLVFILRKTVNYSVNLFSNRNVNSTSDVENWQRVKLLLLPGLCGVMNTAVDDRTRVSVQTCVHVALSTVKSRLVRH